MTDALQVAVVSLVLLLGGSIVAAAQSAVVARITPPAPTAHSPDHHRTALFWLEPLSSDLQQQLEWKPQGAYRLVQKDKMFAPHLLVVPAGATVSFPNTDPFFHNVFSLYEGKRFDLGLYEAGTSRDVRFSQTGISYIFCNIHPAMGAVIIVLRTRLWSAGRRDGTLRIAAVPPGDYEAHLWLEGEDEHRLALWTHPVHIRDHGSFDAGTFQSGAANPNPEHLNKFGKPYAKDSAPY